MATLQLVRHRFWDNDGSLLSGGKVYIYDPGTTTPKNSYTDSTGLTPNAWPLILDAKGEAGIWITSKFKINVTNSVDVQVTGYPVDNILLTSDDIYNSFGGSGGASLVGYAATNLGALFSSHVAYVATSIAALRAIDKTKYAQAAITGYYVSGDGGGGAYYYDATDTTNVDNGGTIIVAADGGRWKLARNVPVNIKQFGAKVDGVTDDYAAITAAITWTSANGGGIVDFPAGTTAISTGIVVPYHVQLRGAGCGGNWSTGDGVTWGTNPSTISRILWKGGYVAASIVSFGDGVFDSGISDIQLDGGLSVGNITTYQADFNAGTFAQPSLNGIHSTSTLRMRISRVAIQNVTTGLLMDSAPNHVNGFNIIDSFLVMTCNHAIRQFGLFTAAVANTSFKDCALIGYYNRGIDFIAWTDSNHYENIYMATSAVPSVGIWYNSSVPGGSNGVGFNNFVNLIMDLYNPSAADNGMRSIVCGYTAPGYSYVTGFISGATNSVPSLLPEIRANGLLIWTQGTAPSYTMTPLSLWQGGARAGTTLTTFAPLDSGALTFFNSNHWNSLYSTLALVANFKPASKISRIDWVIYWNPGSTTGSVKLVNDGNGSALSTVITPGAAGAVESMQDVTSLFLPLAAGAVPNYASPNDFRIALHTAGNGTVAATIYTSFLRIITSDFS